LSGVANGSFETSDGRGNADSWSWTIVVTAAKYAPYNVPADRSRFDGFELGWGADVFVDSIVDGTNGATAFYDSTFGDPMRFEGFERHWSGNETFVDDLASAEAAEYGGTPPETFDGFESGWSNFPFLVSLGAVDVAMFHAGADPFDGFEAGWLTSPFETDIGSVSTAAAAYVEGGSSGAAETFEAVRPDLVFQVGASSNLYFIPSHPFSGGETVTVYNAGDGELFNPAGATLSTDNGAGTNYISNDPAKYWTGLPPI
jgi:hypothetical protein